VTRREEGGGRGRRLRTGSTLRGIDELLGNNGELIASEKWVKGRVKE